MAVQGPRKSTCQGEGPALDVEGHTAICKAFDPVFANVEQLAVACDLQGRIVTANPVFDGLYPKYDYNSRSIFFPDIPIVVVDASLTNRMHDLIIGAIGGTPGFLDYEVDAETSNVFYIGWSVAPVCNEAGSVAWVLVQAFDYKGGLQKRAELTETNAILEEEVQHLKRRSTDLEWSVDTLEGQGNVLVEIADEGELVRIELAAEIEERKRLEAELTQIAITDPLTGIFNRRRWMEVGSEELAKMQNGYKPFSIISFDVDHFKKVNDSWSHQAGDDVLIALTTVCETALEDLAERLFRIGGEEFICLVQATDVDAAMLLAENLRGAIEQMRVRTCGETLTVTASFGVTECVPGESLSSVLSRADKALYQAKDQGRNCCVQI